MYSALSVATLSNLVREVAEPTSKMLNIVVLTLSDIDVLDFGLPVPEGWSQFPRHPAKRVDIFIKAMVIVMAYGTESSSDISAVRSSTRR